MLGIFDRVKLDFEHVFIVGVLQAFHPHAPATL